MLTGLVLFLGSCTGVPRNREPVPGLGRVTLEEVEDSLKQNNYTRALFYLQVLELRGYGSGGAAADESTEKELLEQLKGEALQGLRNSISEAAEDGRLLTAESYARSLAALGEDPVGGSPGKSVDRGEVDSQSWLVPHLYRRAETIDEIHDEELSSLLKSAMERGVRTAAAAFYEEMKKRSLAVPVEYAEWSQTSAKRAADTLDAVVTVWVNRGMRIEGGVGLPDRVIGSGFFIDPEGYLITNYHVISSEVDPSYEGFSRLYIKLSRDSDTRIPAKVVGHSEIFDIALLKVEVEPEEILSFNLDPDLRVGETIYALGSPGGLENTLTSGIISSTGRKILQMGDVVQVDVPINQGNSGGPLLNERGELIGVVFAGIEQFEGINFAIPGHWVLKLLPQLYQGGAFPHAALGASFRKVNRGLEVIYLAPGTPLEKLDVQVGDILISLDGTRMKEIKDAHPLLLSSLPGELVSSRWQREDHSFERILLTIPRKGDGIKEYAEIDNPLALFPALFGMEAVVSSQGLMKDRYRIERVYPGSIADESGLSPGDPFTLERWSLIEDAPFVLARLRIKKRKAGFLESGIQIPGYLEPPNFL